MTTTAPPAALTPDAAARQRGIRFAVAGVLLGVADLVLTLVGLHLGGSEGNPLAAHAFALAGPVPVMVAAIPAYAALAWWFGRSSRRAGLFICSFKTIAVVLNIIVIVLLLAFGADVIYPTA